MEKTFNYVEVADLLNEELRPQITKLIALKELAFNPELNLDPADVVDCDLVRCGVYSILTEVAQSFDKVCRQIDAMVKAA